MIYFSHNTIIIFYDRTHPIRHQQGFLYNPPTTLKPIYKPTKNWKFKPPTHVDSQVRLIPTKTSTKYVESLPPRYPNAEVIK